METDEHSVVCGKETRIERVEVSFSEGNGDPLSRLWDALPPGGEIQLAKRHERGERVLCVARVLVPGDGYTSGPGQPLETDDGVALSSYAVVTLALLGLLGEAKRKGRL
jgi:hypothetical protein